MTTTTEARPAVSDDRPGLIHAKPVRHPGRWVAIAVIAVLALMFLHLLIFNPAFNWPLVFQAMNPEPGDRGLLEGHHPRHHPGDDLRRGTRGGAGGDAAVRQPRSQGSVVGLHLVLPRHPALRAARRSWARLASSSQRALALGVPFDWKIIDWLGFVR